MYKFPTILFFVLALTLCSCSTKEPADFCLNGPWSLESKVFSDGLEVSYPYNNSGWLRIYDDSCYYDCQIIKAPTGTLVIPNKRETYLLINKGKEFRYLQGGGVHPFTMVDDSTIVVQEMGSVCRWKINNDIEEEKINAIVDVINNDVDDIDDFSHRYIFSNAERDLKASNHTLTYILIFAVFVIVVVANVLYNLYRHKKRIEQELRQIEQERKLLPESVREALNAVEQGFYRSDFYNQFQAKINKGARLTKDDWDALQERLLSVYPRFVSTLDKLCNMSEIEFRVCLLLKLKITPSEIANVLHRDISSISSIRSRLYMKVFGKKGSSKDFDEFISSL